MSNPRGFNGGGNRLTVDELTRRANMPKPRPGERDYQAWMRARHELGMATYEQKPSNEYQRQKYRARKMRERV